MTWPWWPPPAQVVHHGWAQVRWSEAVDNRYLAMGIVSRNGTASHSTHRPPTPTDGPIDPREASQPAHAHLPCPLQAVEVGPDGDVGIKGDRCGAVVRGQGCGPIAGRAVACCFCAGVNANRATLCGRQPLARRSQGYHCPPLPVRHVAVGVQDMLSPQPQAQQHFTDGYAVEAVTAGQQEPAVQTQRGSDGSRSKPGRSAIVTRPGRTAEFSSAVDIQTASTSPSMAGIHPALKHLPCHGRSLDDGRIAVCFHCVQEFEGDACTCSWRCFDLRNCRRRARHRATPKSTRQRRVESTYQRVSIVQNAFLVIDVERRTMLLHRLRNCSMQPRIREDVGDHFAQSGAVAASKAMPDDAR